MNDNCTPWQATPAGDLRNQIMNSNIPKNEREWWAARCIKELERKNAKLHEALTKAEAHDESLHAFDDLQCFVDDPDTRNEYWPEYCRRCNQRQALGTS
jgi:hypothetical protein